MAFDFSLFYHKFDDCFVDVDTIFYNFQPDSRPSVQNTFSKRAISSKKESLASSISKRSFPIKYSESDITDKNAYALSLSVCNADDRRVRYSNEIESPHQ